MVWSVPTDQPFLYLTFDDGPDPSVTPWVLEVLEEFNASATFFCVGHQVQKHPEIAKQLIHKGHTIGNHTYHHPDGWTTSVRSYLNNVERCAEVVNSKLFRPPYGKLTPFQFKKLRNNYHVVMWDVLGADFDPRVSGQQVYQNVVNNVQKGSIIVLHDSITTKKKLKFALPALLEDLSQKNYQFKSLACLNK